MSGRETESESDGEEYSISKLIKFRKTKKWGPEYLVQWEGTDPETGAPWEPSWEPADEIEQPHNKEILETFHKTVDNKNEKTQTSPKKRRAPPRQRKEPETAPAVEKKRKRRAPTSPGSEPEAKKTPPPTPPTSKEKEALVKEADKKAKKEKLQRDIDEKQKKAIEAKRLMLVTNPEIIDQRKCLEKGDKALISSNYDEALRLYQKANRIYSDARSLEAIQRVEAEVRERAEILELEEKAREAEEERRRRYEALNDEDKALAVYIENIIELEKTEPVRKNITSKVKHATFEYFMKLYFIPLPGKEETLAISKSTVANFETRVVRDLTKLKEQHAIINQFLKRKLRFISRAVHPDKCTLDGAGDVQKIMNKGRELVSSYLRETFRDLHNVNI